MGSRWSCRRHSRHQLPRRSHHRAIDRRTDGAQSWSNLHPPDQASSAPTLPALGPTRPCRAPTWLDADPAEEPPLIWAPMQTIRTAIDKKGVWIRTKNGPAVRLRRVREPGGDCSWFACAGAASFKASRQLKGTAAQGFQLPGRTARSPGLPRTSWAWSTPRPSRQSRPMRCSRWASCTAAAGELARVLDGRRPQFESRRVWGVSGHVVAGTARAWNDSLFHDSGTCRNGRPGRPQRLPAPGRLRLRLGDRP